MKKSKKQEVELDEVRNWVEDGDYVKNYNRFARRVWKRLVKTKDAKEKGVSRNEILENPGAYGYTYKMFKELMEARRSHDDL